MDKNIYEVGIIEHKAFDEIKQLFAENKIDPASTGLVRENYLIYLKPGVEAGPNEAIWEIPNTSIYGLYNDNAYKKNLEDAANHLIETQNISKMWLMLYSPKTKLKFHWDFFKCRHLVSLNENDRFFSYMSNSRNIDEYNDWLEKYSVDEFNDMFINDDKNNFVGSLKANIIYEFGNTLHTFVNDADELRINFIYETFE